MVPAEGPRRSTAVPGAGGRLCATHDRPKDFCGFGAALPADCTRPVPFWLRWPIVSRGYPYCRHEAGSRGREARISSGDGIRGDEASKGHGARAADTINRNKPPSLRSTSRSATNRNLPTGRCPWRSTITEHLADAGLAAFRTRRARGGVKEERHLPASRCRRASRKKPVRPGRFGSAGVGRWEGLARPCGPGAD